MNATIEPVTRPTFGRSSLYMNPTRSAVRSGGVDVISDTFDVDV